MVLLCTKRAEKCTCVLFVYSVFSHFPKKMTKFAGENSYGMNMPTELSDMKRLLSATIALSLCACGGQQMHYYQLAQESLERQDAPQALHYLLQAAEAGNDADSLTAQVYSDIGSLYFDQGLTDKALQAYRRAYHADSLRNDSTGMAFDLRDIGNVYRSLENDDSSLVYFEHALLMTCDPMLRHDIESQMAGYHLWHGNYAEAHIVFPAGWETDVPSNGVNQFSELRRPSAEAEEATWVDVGVREEAWDNKVRMLFLVVSLIVILVAAVNITRRGRTQQSRRTLVRTAATFAITALGEHLFFREPLTTYALVLLAIVAALVSLAFPVEGSEEGKDQEEQDEEQQGQERS